MLGEAHSFPYRLSSASVITFHQNISQRRTVREDVHNKNVIKCRKDENRIEGRAKVLYYSAVK